MSDNRNDRGPERCDAGKVGVSVDALAEELNG